MSSTATKTVCQSCGGVIWPDCQHICSATLPIVVYKCSKCGGDVENIGMHICSKTQEVQSDLVNHPPHYKRGGLECIDVIDAIGANFYVGQVFKYLWRSGLKGDEKTMIEDCKKALWYLSRHVDNLKNGRE